VREIGEGKIKKRGEKKNNVKEREKKK